MMFTLRPILIFRGRNSTFQSWAPERRIIRSIGQATPPITLWSRLNLSKASLCLLLIKIGFLRVLAASWLCLGHRVCLAAWSPPPRVWWRNLLPLLGVRRLFLSVIFLRLGLLCTHSSMLICTRYWSLEIDDDLCQQLETKWAFRI